MEKIIIHIDVNNAFLSWTAVNLLNKGFKTDIRNIVSVIGYEKDYRRGIVLAKSILAKKYNIVTGEPIYSALKKYSKLKVFKPDYNLYNSCSNNMFEYLYSLTPDIEIYSIDECFIDFTKVKNIYMDEILFAKKIQKEIYEKFGFTVNIGIGNNKLCAKMASNFEKPNKIHTLYKNEIYKMQNLDIQCLFGIGKKTAEKLRKIKINKICDLAKAKEEELFLYFKNKSKFLINLANGIDCTEVCLNLKRKGISKEITLNNDIINKNILEKYLFTISQDLAFQLRKESFYTNSISLITKDIFLKRKSYQITFSNNTNSQKKIFEYSRKILNKIELENKIRLIGIRINNLNTNNIYQCNIFEEYKPNYDDRALNNTIDSLNLKYNKNIIKNGINLDKEDF